MGLSPLVPANADRFDTAHQVMTLLWRYVWWPLNTMQPVNAA